MTISYNWLSDYLPVKVAPERLSGILTSIGLEVESMEPYEEVKGGLKGLIIGEVLETGQHPNADKLKLTKVNIGATGNLEIICGAPNVAPGQKVVVAPIGTTIYPLTGEPLTMKLAKIRGLESYGMICAEDEIGLGSSHAGIMVLPDDATAGMAVADYLKPYNDVIFEIGLTPNRADAMSHWGVARDVCAYLSHHDGKGIKPRIPETEVSADKQLLNIDVEVENMASCPRYSGVCLTNIKVAPSPQWLRQRLKSIGVRPINNIVDITNFILHETGQPLHAFDYDAIKGGQVIVKNEAENTPFKTLDGKERKLNAEDLMICNAQEAMCIAGVFGGLQSGVTQNTKNIFLESAFFDPITIRKTSFRHGLRTDAATRFEKGIDISSTVRVLKRAATLMKELAGGEIASPIVDVYPNPEPKKQVALKFGYLKKLSGKDYHREAVKSILENLEFSIIKEDEEALMLEVPHHKRDIHYGADLVEEILRIDGLDNIDIPATITITPSVEEDYTVEALKEKTATTLVGLGFTEILTNSITNSKHFSEAELANTVKLLNNISVELDVLRPAMLPTALEVIAHNINRKGTNLKFFEFGKTYRTSGAGVYEETNHLCLYVTGNNIDAGWKAKAGTADVYYLKGLVESILKAIGLNATVEEGEKDAYLGEIVTAIVAGKPVAQLGQVTPETTARFDIKQPVFFANFNWDVVADEARKNKVLYKEVSKFQPVERDLAIVVPKERRYEEIQKGIAGLSLDKLREVRLFDIFESDKLGSGKKSLAVNFTFLDAGKTLTDKEVDNWMNRIMKTLETEVGAEIRRQ